MSIRYVIAAFLIASLMQLMGLFASFAHAENTHDKDWTLNLKDVDISVFLEHVSSITGENFVLDPQVKGKVTVVATTPMNAQAVHELLLTVLRVNGLAAVASGSSTRIVPQANVKLGSTQLYGGTVSQEQMVTRVIPIKNSNVEDMVRILKPLVSATGYLEGSEFSNALIVSDYEDNMTQIMKAITGLDRQENADDVEVIPLKSAWVGNIVPLIEAVSPMQLGESNKNHNRLRVIADERSNSIIVKGDLKDRQQIRRLVETFDTKVPNSSDIQMIHLQYADAKEVATLLRGTVFSSSKDAQGASTEGSEGAPISPANANGSINSGPPVSAGGGSEDIANAKSFIQPDITINALVIKAEPAVMSEIRALIKQLDVPRPQVLIEAAIVEISADKTEQLGVQFGGGDIARTLNAGVTQFSTNETSLGTVLSQLGSANASAIGSDGITAVLGKNSNFNVLVQALATTDGANLLSTPSIITLDNQEAKIVVGQNVPFRTGTFTTQSSGVTNPFTTIERQDIGITLKVLPQIHEGNLVRLNIEQEVSSIAPANAQDAGAADIITNKRTINTNVLAEDGQTVVLGGLMEDDVQDSVSKVPLLGDIPYLGALFRNKTQSYTKSNLLVFLRPTVLHSRQQVSDVAQERYSRVYDLQLGRRNLGDTEDVSPQPTPAPSVDTIFNPPPKVLPWLVGDGKPPADAVIPTTQTPSTINTRLPWQTQASRPDNSMPVMAAPVAPVETFPISTTATTLPWQTHP